MESHKPDSCDQLIETGLPDNELFVPLLMVSIGEQVTRLEDVVRIIHHTVTEFTERDLNIAISSLADPADWEHKIYPLMRLYEETYGDFPHDRVHSTMRVYLDNERLEVRRRSTGPARRPWSGGRTPATTASRPRSAPTYSPPRY